MTVLLFIIILGVLVFVHEFGHFIIAKRSGIRVDEFAIGFPPRIVSKKFGETNYALNLIPFGGYVKIHGEDPADPSADSMADNSRSFSSKNRAIQALVLLGGISMNFIFAWLLISGLFIFGMTVSSSDYPGQTLENERLMIVDVFAESPAAQAGLRAGDSIRALTDSGETQAQITLPTVQDFIAAHEGREIAFEIEHGGEISQIKVVPKQGVVTDVAGIGVSLDTVGELELSLISAFIEGAVRMWDLTRLTAVAIAGFLYDAVTFKADLSSISGPVGIARFVGDAWSLGWFYLISFTALISINLAVINLIPFPALDGGRLLFVAIEAVIRRPLPAKFVRGANVLGFTLLMILLVAVSYKDVLGLF